MYIFAWFEGTHENLFTRKKVLHENNFTLIVSSHNYFYTRTHVRSISYLLYKYIRVVEV